VKPVRRRIVPDGGAAATLFTDGSDGDADTDGAAGSVGDVDEMTTCGIDPIRSFTRGRQKIERLTGENGSVRRTATG